MKIVVKWDRKTPKEVIIYHKGTRLAGFGLRWLARITNGLEKTKTPFAKLLKICKKGRSSCQFLERCCICDTKNVFSEEPHMIKENMVNKWTDFFLLYFNWYTRMSSVWVLFDGMWQGWSYCIWRFCKLGICSLFTERCIFKENWACTRGYEQMSANLKHQTKINLLTFESKSWRPDVLFYIFECRHTHIGLLRLLWIFRGLKIHGPNIRVGKRSHKFLGPVTE